MEDVLFAGIKTARLSTRNLLNRFPEILTFEDSVLSQENTVSPTDPSLFMQAPRRQEHLITI